MPSTDDVARTLERDGWVSDENLPGARKLCAHLAREGVLVARVRWVLRESTPAARREDRAARVVAALERLLPQGPATAHALARASGHHPRDVLRVLAELAAGGGVVRRKRGRRVLWEIAPWVEPADPA